MVRDTLQIRIVTGEGFLHDRDWGLYEDLSVEDVQRAAKHLELAAVGTLFDFLAPETLEGLLGAEALTDGRLEKLETCWHGKPLPAGTAYGVLLGEAQALGYAQRRLQARLQAEMSGDRFEQAAEDRGFLAVLEPASGSLPGKREKAPRGRMPVDLRGRLHKPDPRH